MTTSTTVPLAGRLAAATAHRTHASRVATRHAKRAERNGWRSEARAEIAALKLVTR